MDRTPEGLRARATFDNYVTENWVWYLLVGVASILFGLVVMSFDFATIRGFAIFVGAVLVGWGVIEIIGALRASSSGSSGVWAWAPGRWVRVAAAIVSIAAGVVVWAWPRATIVLWAIDIGWALLFWGLAEIVDSLMSRHVSQWWLELIRGIVTIALGVWAVRHADQPVLVFVFVVGALAVLWGAIDIIEALQMRFSR